MKNKDSLVEANMEMRLKKGNKFFFYAWIALVSFSQVGFAEKSLTSPKEALVLRRITEYWKDGDYATVKRQISAFLEKNPESTLHDHLRAMLGDLCFEQKEYEQALESYDLISDSEIAEKVFINRLQTQFELHQFLKAIENAERYLKKNNNTSLETRVRYIMAESYFREALRCKNQEEKNHYLKLAKPHYKALTQSKYSEQVIFPLAEVHRLLREDERAVSLYLSLADKYPEHRERFLFQSAILQIKLNKEEAQASFKKVYELGGKRSKLAAFNLLILLYQQENYSEFITFYENVIGSMPEQKVPLLKFYAGRSLYAMGDYQQAVMPLEQYVSEISGRTKELKTAYLLLINCCRYNNDIHLFDQTLCSFQKIFPKDQELPKAILIHSRMCQENGDLEQALEDIQTLLTNHPVYSEKEELKYDYALLLSQMDNWIESRENFLSFLEKYPNSDKCNTAWRNLLNCCIQEIKNPTQEVSDVTKEAFVQIMQKALSEKGVLTDREIRQYSLIMMKCQCELGMFDEVIPYLQKFIAETVDDQFLAEAHLLMAICIQKTTSDLSQFIQSAQTALAYDSKLPEKNLLHLELFNAYLSKFNEAQDEADRQHFLRQAADNLFDSSSWKDRSIKLDNYLWLAGHFYTRAKANEEGAFKKADALFSVLLEKTDEEGLSVSSDSLYLEGEVLKYSHLLDIQNRHSEQILLLEKLISKQQNQPELPWKLKRRCQLELGHAYEANHQYEDAIKTYNSLLKTGSRVSSMVNNSAQLHLAKLEYQLLKPAQNISTSPEIISILHSLKDLQIQKKLPAEPLHLEAALQYTEIRLSFSDPIDQPKNALFFYKRMFDDFHSQEDPITEEYNHLRASNPEKDAVFGAYMQYIDSQILINQAIVAREEKKVEKASEYEETALRILNELIASEEYLRPYLYDRIENSRATLTKQL